MESCHWIWLVNGSVKRHFSIRLPSKKGMSANFGVGKDEALGGVVHLNFRLQRRPHGACTDRPATDTTMLRS